eukprot:CAMPEP_0194125478 /NCGR_PEP_ID=MMETSP0150-20130528/59484_1 /TAXON_ID=122233 /ORGANISM="Chaetoceros debilis, Strain MM31A-1" /LENGTH=1369 /DNA_ID=CAMNT_0038819289 /DNA_START=171 /DNA_END=4280 /DNA_ORIENTATION=-
MNTANNESNSPLEARSRRHLPASQLHTSGPFNRVGNDHERRTIKSNRRSTTGNHTAYESDEEDCRRSRSNSPVTTRSKRGPSTPRLKDDYDVGSYEIKLGDSHRSADERSLSSIGEISISDIVERQDFDISGSRQLDKMSRRSSKEMLSSRKSYEKDVSISRSNSPFITRSKRHLVSSQLQEDLRTSNKDFKKERSRQSVEEVEDVRRSRSNSPVTTRSKRRLVSPRLNDGVGKFEKKVDTIAHSITRRCDTEQDIKSSRFGSLRKRSTSMRHATSTKLDTSSCDKFNDEIRSLQMTNEMLEKKMLAMEGKLQRLDGLESTLRCEIKMHSKVKETDEEVGKSCDTMESNACKIFKLKEMVQTLQDEIDQLKSSGKSSDNESTYLAEGMLVLLEKVDVVENKLVQLQDSSSRSSLIRPLSSSFFVRTTDEGTLPEDTITLIMLTRPIQNKSSWLVGTLIYSFQMAVSGLILSSQFEASRGSSLFTIPFVVDPIVRAGQCFGIIFCSSTQNDILTSIQSVAIFWRSTRWDLVLLEGDDRYQRNRPHFIIWLCIILIPNIFKLMKGLSMAFVSFVIIVQSDSIIELLKNLIALMVISETDYITFQLAKSGYLGQTLHFKATRATSIDFREDSSAVNMLNFWTRPFVLMTVLSGMLAGWLYIVYNQETGVYFDQRFPGCIGNFLLAKENFGDGMCYGGPLNTLGCEFEAGDCINFNLAFPDCKGDNLTFVENELGNNICNDQFSSIGCKFDGGDCCPLNITQHQSFGNGICDRGEGNNMACDYDGGDCIEDNKFCDETNGEGECCPFEIYSSPSFGNGICDSEANIELCGFDNGDCNEYIRDFCIDGDVSRCCPFDLVFNSYTFGDGQCHGGIANTKLCKYDMGDCNDFLRKYPYCPLDEASNREGSATIVLGNAICESGIYNSEACGYESGDCDVGQVGQDLATFVGTLDSDSNVNLEVQMSADGSTLALGLPRTSDSGVHDILSLGSVRVFRFDYGQKIWTRIDGNSMRGEKAGEEFGESMAMNENGSRLAIGSPMYGYKGTESGQIKVFDYDISINKWTPVGQIIEGDTSSDQAGRNIAMSQDGSILAVSAPYRTVGRVATGRIRIFNLDLRKIDPLWVQIGQNIDGQETNENIGRTYLHLSSYGTVLVFSAGREDEPSNMSTRVYAFQQDKEKWYQQGDDIASPHVASGSAAISADGDRIAIGTNSTNMAYPGEVMVYGLDATSNSWIEISDVIHDKSSSSSGSMKNQRPEGDGFGHVVEMSYTGDSLAISIKDLSCIGGEGSFHICATGTVEIYDFMTSSAIKTKVIKERPRDRGNSIFGLHLSFGESQSGYTLLSISGFHEKKESAYVKVYNLDEMPDAKGVNLGEV